MFGAILKATNSSFQKGMTFWRNIYVKKVMKLLAFIFEQPSYLANSSKAERYNAQMPVRTALIHKHITPTRLIYCLIALCIGFTWGFDSNYIIFSSTSCDSG